MKFKIILMILIAVIALPAVLIGCKKSSTGNGTAGGNDNGVIAGPDVSWGVMKKGSVIVNGVTFNVDGAEIVHDDSPGSDTLLRDGMTVKLRGTRNTDGVTGVAQKIETECELQGTITAIRSDSITLIDQQAFADSRTVFENAVDFQALDVGQWVTIHGLRDPLDRLLATRIEVRTAGGGPSIDRLKGAVEAPFTGGDPPALTFTLRGITVVTARGTLIQPAGAVIGPGDPVTVHGFLSGDVFSAGRIDREDLEDAAFDPRENEKFHVGGFVSGFTAAGADFTMRGTTVRVTADTRFEDGAPDELVNNVRVEVEGRITGGALVADKIKFDDTVRLRANAETAGNANVLGLTVVVTSRTELEKLDTGVAGLAPGQGLRIRGFENPDGSVTATHIELQSSPVGNNGIVVQGIVKAFDAAARTVTVLGITFNAAGAAAFGPYEGAVPVHPPVSLDQFFSLLTVDRTVVKAEGSFSPGPPPVLTAITVEIE